FRSVALVVLGSSMPYRPPLVPHEVFVADPPALSVRAPGESGLSSLTAAEVVATESSSVTLKARTTAGESLVVHVGAAGEGVIRVRLSQDPHARSRSAAALPLVRPGRFERTLVTNDDGLLRIHAGALTAELTLDPWHLRFLDASGRVLLTQDRGERDIS